MLAHLLVLTLQLGSSCVYLRAPLGTPSPCTTTAPGQSGFEGPDVRCRGGLPVGVRLRFLPSGSVCVGAQWYERVEFNDPHPIGRGADLSEWASITRLCRDPPRPRPLRRRWWLPTVGFSVQRSLQLSPEGAGFSDATTFWLTLTFPFPSAQRAPPPPDRRRFTELCDAARRLNQAMSIVGCARLRTRADLQLLAWRDELEALLEWKGKWTVSPGGH